MSKPRCHIICNNSMIEFEVNSLSLRLALKIIRAMTYAYEKSISIASYPYIPTNTSKRAAYITACQLVHDNLADVSDGQEVRNLCLEKLRA